MTTTTQTFVHCDHANCDRRTPETALDGWAVEVYTHGCPDHREVIAAHAANIDCNTTRGKDYWNLKCKCGWVPKPVWELWSSRRLQADHLAHVREVTAQ